MKISIDTICDVEEKKIIVRSIEISMCFYPTVVSRKVVEVYKICNATSCCKFAP